MSKWDDENSSTSRLLDIIRKDSPEDEKTDSDIAEKISGPAYKSSAIKLFSFKKTPVIGVDIGYNYITVIKAFKNPGKNFQISDYSISFFDPDLRKNEGNFLRFLKASMKKVINTRVSDIWVTSHIETIDIRCLKVPKVHADDMANAVLWAYKKKHPFDDKNFIFDFEVIGKAKDADNKLLVMACTVSIREIENMEALFSKAGYNISGICSYSFAVQNLFKTNLIQGKTRGICCFHAGLEWSRIDIFFPDGSLGFSRKIKSSITSIVEAIHTEIFEIKQTIPFMDNKIFSKAMDQAKEIFHALIYDSGRFYEVVKKAGQDITKDKILKIIQPVLKRMAWQIERTIDNFLSGIGDYPIGKIYISGQIGSSREIVKLIGEELYITTLPIQDYLEENYFHIRGNDKNPPVNNAETNLTYALGMVFSKNFFTTNFLFTYEDKHSHTRYKSIKRYVIILFLFLMAICFGVYNWQNNLIIRENIKIAGLRNKISTISEKNKILVDRALVKNQVDYLVKNRVIVSNYLIKSRKKKMLAVIKEICDATPKNIRLFNMKIMLKGLKEPGKPKIRKEQVYLKGIVLGKPLSFETDLVEYLSEIEAKPIFSGSSVKNKKQEQYDGKPVLGFELLIDIE